MDRIRGKPQCTSYFVASACDWMDCSAVSGKLYCPKCTARVGSYNWSGSQCSYILITAPVAAAEARSACDVPAPGRRPADTPPASSLPPSAFP